jgi:hypothetical protein
MSLSLDDIVDSERKAMMEDGGGDQVTPTQICTTSPLAEVNQPDLRGCHPS